MSFSRKSEAWRCLVLYLLPVCPAVSRGCGIGYGAPSSLTKGKASQAAKLKRWLVCQMDNPPTQDLPRSVKNLCVIGNAISFMHSSHWYGGRLLWRCSGNSSGASYTKCGRWSVGSRCWNGEVGRFEACGGWWVRMISYVAPSVNLTFSVKRHAVNPSSFVFNSGVWIVSFTWSSSAKGLIAGNFLVLTVLVSSQVSAA